MSRASLEQRVEAIEQQLASLLARSAGETTTKDWRRTRGAFSGDDLMKQVFSEGRRIREADRRTTRPRRPRKQSAKP